MAKLISIAIIVLFSTITLGSCQKTKANEKTDHSLNKRSVYITKPVYFDFVVGNSATYPQAICKSGKSSAWPFKLRKPKQLQVLPKEQLRTILGYRNDCQCDIVFDFDKGNRFEYFMQDLTYIVGGNGAIPYRSYGKYSIENDYIKADIYPGSGFLSKSSDKGRENIPGSSFELLADEDGNLYIRGVQNARTDGCSIGRLTEAKE